MLRFLMGGWLTSVLILLFLVNFWFFIWPKFTKKVDLLTKIVLNPKDDSLKKELIEQYKGTAKLNLEVCKEFEHTEPKIKRR